MEPRLYMEATEMRFTRHSALKKNTCNFVMHNVPATSQCRRYQRVTSRRQCSVTTRDAAVCNERRHQQTMTSTAAAAAAAAAGDAGGNVDDDDVAEVHQLCPVGQ